MTQSDFYVDFNSEVPNFDEALQQEVDQRLRELAEERNDIVGAAVAVTQPAKANSPFVYQARIVIYKRPEDLAAVKQADSINGAIKDALEAIERQVREQRKKLDEPWKRPDIPGTST
jgi:ribosome-associated translation inhibitor RaiA